MVGCFTGFPIIITQIIIFINWDYFTFNGPLHNTKMKVANPKVVINVIISKAREDRVVLGLLVK